MMKINLSLVVLLLNLMQVLAIIKETISYDAKGQVIRKVTSDDSEVVKCWKYTWLGTETDKTNYTSNCDDLISADGPVRPCHEPLVWTYNDEFGANEPDLGEIADTCSETGCVPYCVPGPSETCVKYTEWTGNHMSYTSAFCGKVNLGWAEGKSNLDRCYRAGLKEYCACDVFMRTQCNSGNTVSTSLTVMVIISVMLCLR